jgi:copper chaperone
MLELQVEGMTCAHCASVVMKAVKGVDGAARVDIDIAANKVTVESDANPEVIKYAVIEAGYAVTGMVTR